MTHTQTVNKGILLTAAPNRSSPEAETCRAPHRCEWSEPPLVLESNKTKTRWKIKIAFLHASLVESSNIKIFFDRMHL